MEKYTLAIFLTSCFIAVVMTIIKKIIVFIRKKKKIEEPVSDTVFRTIALCLSGIATVLSWWILHTPEEFKACILYVCPVYIFQEIFDLDIIKRIIKAVAKAKLNKAGVKEEDLEF